MNISFLFTTALKSMKYGPGLDKNLLLTLELSYSDSENNLKDEVNRGLTLRSTRTFPANNKMVVKFCGTRDLRISTN